jgi:hypothetical protein
VSPEAQKTAEELLAELEPAKPAPVAVVRPKIIAGDGRPGVYRVRPTADQAARGKRGDRVPGVTTVVKRFQESGGLIHWAYKCGLDDIDINEARDDAATAGHLGHDWVEDTIHERPLREPDKSLTDEQVAGARTALNAFIEWRDQVQLEIVATEVPLVSEALRFGGTLDAIFRLKRSRLVLGDWKTGNRVYSEHLAQLGGYAILIEENDLLAQLGGGALDGVQLLRFDKEFGSFAHYSWPLPVLEIGKSAFRQMRSLYDVCHRLGKAVG